MSGSRRPCSADGNLSEAEESDFITLDNGCKFLIPDEIARKYAITNDCHAIGISIRKEQFGKQCKTPPKTCKKEPLGLPCDQYETSKVEKSFNAEDWRISRDIDKTQRLLAGEFQQTSIHQQEKSGGSGRSGGQDSGFQDGSFSVESSSKASSHRDSSQFVSRASAGKCGCEDCCKENKKKKKGCL